VLLVSKPGLPCYLSFEQPLQQPQGLACFVSLSFDGEQGAPVKHSINPKNCSPPCICVSAFERTHFGRAKYTSSNGQIAVGGKKVRVNLAANARHWP